MNIFLIKFRNLFILLITTYIFFSCSGSKNNAAEPIQVLIKRFDKDFFMSDLKENQIDSLSNLYPYFFSDFIENILGIPNVPDNQQEVKKALKDFKKNYQPLFDSTQKTFQDLTNLENEFEAGFQSLRKILPAYSIPRVVAFIGPIDAIYQSWYGQTPDFINDSLIGINLLLHSGSYLSHHQKNILAEVYDSYLLKKFTKETIVPNCFKNIIDDIYPDNTASKNLINQIVEKGKKIYLVKQILPNIPDSVLFGYSSVQLLNCQNSESLIWRNLLYDNNLYSKDPQVIRNFIGDAPFTAGMSHLLPGYIGLWIGYQIVESYMLKHNEKKLVKLIKIDNEKLFKESNYKPKNHN